MFGIVNAQHCADTMIYNVMQGFTYPQDVAYPIGGEGTPQYVVLEVHYNNPTEVSGEL